MSKEWNYYNYACLPSTELRGKRPEHQTGYCGRPMLRKSKESLPIQGSPCPNCGRRTRVNETNLIYDDSYTLENYNRAKQTIEYTERRAEFVKDKTATNNFHQRCLQEWHESQNQTSKSIFSNVSEETVEKIEQFAEKFEQFVEGVE